MALCALALLSPVILVVAFLIRIILGSPVFFLQDRPGLHGKLFRMVKFRSMRVPRLGESELASDGVRLTAFGKFLRKTSLDELPELWNVLRGEMSLVGPRPLLPQYLVRYNSEQRRRHEVRPGLTGWAQVNGRNAVTWKDRLAMDVWYVDHVSLGLDIQILFRTIGVVFLARGVQADGQATMGEFRGNE
jgi:lipopolysaccharide/colanic/teichoic acid biosynthesis glycosyltransferase